ncbi:MAG: HAMP domain-containing histidine kinase, partial [Phycisphaerae bacterium]|nr:HAMP domain-containing histidine kinase [Phycisphaerae bacterium]
LPTLLGEIVELIQPQCDRRNVALITEVHEDIPPLPCDQGGIHQAVMNLLSNALDVVDPGSGVVTLRAEYDQGGQEVRISVSDNGDGIDDQTMRRLFHPFYSTKGLRGTGLGLAVTKKIIEEHGGSIRVESKFHEGSTFILRLSTRSRQDPSATVVRPGQPERT